MHSDKIAHVIMGLSLVCILLTLVAISAHAEDKSLPQPQAQVNKIEVAAANPVHDVISRQLDAIKARNAELAYSYTTKDFHQKYDDSDKFLSYLRFQLRPLYNHDRYKFLTQGTAPDGYIQQVEIDEHNGQPVTVIYRVEEQEGELLIDSFMVLDPETDPL